MSARSCPRAPVRALLSARSCPRAPVRALLADQAGLAPILLPLLEAWRAMRLRAAELGGHPGPCDRQSEACQILMSVPGVGAVTATSFATAVEDPENFRRSRSV